MISFGGKSGSGMARWYSYMINILKICSIISQSSGSIDKLIPINKEWRMLLHIFTKFCLFEY